MNYRIIPLNNGKFTVSFKGAANARLPKVENVNNFVFLIADENNDAILVDSGFNPDFLAGYQSTYSRTPSQEIPEALMARGFKPAQITHIIQTHLHWDHAAGLEFFPNAEIIIQAHEFIGLLDLNPNEETYFIPQHWLPFADRIRFVNGTEMIKPGIKVHFTGGHSPGHQVVEVSTAESSIIIAGDVPFNYDNLWKQIPAEYWQKYRDDYGKKFYWSEEVIPAIKKNLEKNNLINAVRPRILTMKDLKQSGNRLIFSHDPSLEEIDVIY